MGPPGINGGRTEAGNVSSAVNCRYTVLARRTITVSERSRIHADFTAVWEANANNSRSADVTARLYSGTTLVASVTTRAAFVAAGYHTSSVGGVLSSTASSGTPYAVAPGTYELRLEFFPYGVCSESTTLWSSSLSYLKLSDSD
jgi:hypothetical protein